MTKEELLKIIEDMKTDNLNELTKINIKHDMLLDNIAKLNYLLDIAREDHA